MFFDRRGILLTLAIIFVVILLCVIDLRCSSARDERARRENTPLFFFKPNAAYEMAAGRQAWAQQREEQLNEQLRMLRVMVKQFVEKGEHKRARATIALIQEIEQEKRRRAEKSATDK